jgi:Sulfotransferase family
MTAPADAQAGVREPAVSAEEIPAGSRAPDFFIVGHHKCGTTALYEMLRVHPQIFMPEQKEPWFLARDMRLSAEYSPGVPHTLEQYLALFAAARPEQRIGEATPSYLLSQTAAADIARLQPHARVIAILREPVSFLRSLHLQTVKNHVETVSDLRRALELEPLRREGREIPRDAVRLQDLMYAEHARYVEQLRRYHAVLPREQVLVLIYDDFRRDNVATMREVFRFLDVDDSEPVRAVSANPTVRVRSGRAYELMRSLYLGRGAAPSAAKAVIKLLTPREARRRALDAARLCLYAKPRPLDAGLALELRHRFKPEVVALSEYLARDLVTLWGYGDVT